MNKKIFIVLLIVVAVLLFSGCVRKEREKPPEPTPTPTFTLGPGDYDFSLVHDGLTRIYKVHVPPGYDKNNPLPVVLIFHGGGGNAKGSISYFNLNPKADKEGFIAVYPQATGPELKGEVLGGWNAGRCCYPATTNKIDDVGFISDLLDKLESDFNVDTKRIYATGHSNGALMSYKLACDLSDRVTAIAPVGAVDGTIDCHPKRAVPILHLHGTEDPCAPYNGGTCGGCFTRLLNKVGIPADVSKSEWGCRSVSDYINDWRSIDGCSASSKITYQKGKAKCISYDQCNDKAEITLCTIEGMGHTWPGENYGTEACKRDINSLLCKMWKDIVGNLSNDIIANDMIWEFFKKHPMN